MGMREDYQALMEKQLNEWKAQGERFKAAAEQFEAQAKQRFEENLALVRAKQAQAWEHFNTLKGANEGAWTEFKSHMDKAGNDVKAAMESLAKVFKP